MNYHRWAALALLMLVSLTIRAHAQESVPWHDPSPHSVQFVTVDKDVDLEVLDWGGSGRPLVLLAGLGNTAHVFDDFAPKLTAEYHVYGITRRGYGASSAPASGYEADRLGDDVLAVLDALKLNRPVLVGHSIAGEELSSIGTRHLERVAGLVYLDAAYDYAYYDRSRGAYLLDLNELQKKLDQLTKVPNPSKLAQELLENNLPRFERDLRELQENFKSLPDVTPPAPNVADLASFLAFRSWQMRTVGFAAPESEHRQHFELTTTGLVAKPVANPNAGRAITAGEQKYTDIRVPVLAIYAVPHDRGPYLTDPSMRAAAETRDVFVTGAQASAFESGVPLARVVRLPHASHYVFLSNEADVLREMHAFLASLG